MRGTSVALQRKVTHYFARISGHASSEETHTYREMLRFAQHDSPRGTCVTYFGNTALGLRGSSTTRVILAGMRNSNLGGFRSKYGAERRAPEGETLLSYERLLE